MGIRKLISLGIGAATGYYLYRLITRPPGEAAPQWASEPDPMVENNAVDEASWESFPASDAPAFNSARSIT